ncbi:hypothetical protein ScPMuIL_014086 [Solemya velum]
MALLVLCLSCSLIFMLWATHSRSRPELAISSDVLRHQMNESRRTFRNSISALNSSVNGKRSAHASICSERETNVAFLKVHNAGSTTSLNIFYRFAMVHGLNVVLPRTLNSHYLSFDKSLALPNIYPIPKNETYNILANHVVYNKLAFSSVRDKNTVNVAIAREPTAQFVSAAIYHDLHRKLKNNDDSQKLGFQEMIEDFVTNPGKYKNVNVFWVHNRMSADFGLREKDFYNTRYIDGVIRNISREFTLVMITELYEESLVLLKRRLCWDMKDILFIEVKVHRGDRRDLTQTQALSEGLKKWNSADYKLYHFFKEELLNKIENEGNHFQGEVAYFKKVRQKLINFCRQNNDKNDTLVIPVSRWNTEFAITPVDCELMTMSEIPMWRMMKKRAAQRLELLMPKKVS